jgi:hypothetical protein
MGSKHGAKIMNNSGIRNKDIGIRVGPDFLNL